MATTELVKPRFVLRTIRGGRVQILGRAYHAPHEFPERLDGLRAAFGLYWGPPDYQNYDSRGLMDTCFLWGTEEHYRAAGQDDDTEYERLHAVDPFVEDGVYKWQWWKVAD